MSIKLTDELEVKTKKGKLGAARQMYLDGDVKNLQQAYEEINTHFSTLDNRSSQIEGTIKDISATGGASTANAVSYDNATSKLEAINIQGAVDEVSSTSHFAKRGSTINISTNYNSLNTTEILTLSQAINKISSKDRMLGFQGIYLASDGWHTIIYAGNDLSTWTDSTKWIDFTNKIFNSISKNAMFAGIATPSTNPGSPDGPVFYFAIDEGTYSNFNGISLDVPGLVIFYNDLAGNWVSKKVYDFIDGRAYTEVGAYQYNSAKQYEKIPIKQDTLIKEGYAVYVASNINTNIGVFSENDENRQDIKVNTWTKLQFKPSYINTLLNSNFKIIFCCPEIYDTFGYAKQLVDDLNASLDINAVDIDGYLKNPNNWNIANGRATTKENIPIFMAKRGIKYVDNPEKKIYGIAFTVYDNDNKQLGQTYYSYDSVKREAGASTVKLQITGCDDAYNNIASIAILTSLLNSIKTFGLYSYTKIANDAVTTNKIINGAVVTDKIANDAVTTNKIANGAVVTDKMPRAMWLSSDNLWDDFTINPGTYLTRHGTLSNNPDYDTSDFIKVSPNTKYVFRALYNGSALYETRCICEYSINKEYLGINLENKTEHVTSENCAFIRVTFSSKRNNRQICENTLSTYKPAKYINSEYIIKDDAQTIYYHLPKHIYVPVGLTVELYYKQMLLNANDFYISTTGIGSNLKRKLQIVGLSNKIGIHDLKVVCYNKKEEVVAEATSKVHIVASTIPRTIKVLPIGDSITNSKPWLTRLSTLSSNISTVGTRSNKHEGRSGGTCKFYNTGDSAYSFDVNYTGAGSDAADFNPATQYHVGDYCKYTVNLNVANTQKDVKCVFMFIAEHTGEWDSSKVVNMTTRNPFWDPFTNKFSIDWYKHTQKIDFDIICIWLGTNGISLTPETNENGALGIKTLIDNIRKEDTTTPIIIVNTLFRCSQNGIGKQGNTDGYSPTAEYKHNADKKILLLENAVHKLLDSYSNVYICPVAATFDSEYNYLDPATGKVQVNPYFTDTNTVFELIESDSVHPLNYNQAGDQIFGTISSIVNNQ